MKLAKISFSRKAQSKYLVILGVISEFNGEHRKKDGYVIVRTLESNILTVEIHSEDVENLTIALAEKLDIFMRTVHRCGVIGIEIIK